MWDRWIIEGGRVAEGERRAAKVRMLGSKASERVKPVAYQSIVHGSYLVRIQTSPQYQQVGEKSSELPASNTLLAAKEISE
jgi:hypothetical protein